MEASQGSWAYHCCLRPLSHPARKQQSSINNYSEVWILNLSLSAGLEWGTSEPGGISRSLFLLIQDNPEQWPSQGWSLLWVWHRVCSEAVTATHLRWNSSSSNEILAHLVPSSTSPKHPSEYLIFPLLGACRSHTSLFYTQPGTWQKHDLPKVTSSWQQPTVQKSLFLENFQQQLTKNQKVLNHCERSNYCDMSCSGIQACSDKYKERWGLW